MDQIFRITPGKDGAKEYRVNNELVPKEDFDRRNADTNAAIKTLRGRRPTNAADAFADMDSEIATEKAREMGKRVDNPKTTYPDAAAKAAAQDAANEQAAKAYEERKSQGKKDGGSIKAYKHGGKVCKGVGAATRGTKFRGVF